MDEIEAGIDAAYEALGAQEFDCARERFEALLTRRGDDWQRYSEHFGLGQALRGLGRHELAIDVMLRALEAQPARSDPAAEIAANYMALGRYHDALSYYNRAATMGARDPVDHYNRACVAARVGAFGAMLDGLRSAIKLDPQNRRDAAADPDFAPVLGLPELRTLLRLPPVSPPPWVATLAGDRVLGFRRLEADEIDELPEEQKPLRVDAHEWICELWQIELPFGRRTRRGLFGHNQIAQPWQSRGGQYLALRDGGELVILEVDTDRRWTLTSDNIANRDGTGKLLTDLQIEGWSIDDRLLFTRRPVHDTFAPAFVAHRAGDEWQITPITHELPAHRRWAGSRPVLLFGQRRAKDAHVIELELGGRRNVVLTMGCDEHGIAQVYERAGRYAFRASTRIWLAGPPATPVAMTAPAKFSFYQSPLLSDDGAWLAHLAGEHLRVRALRDGSTFEVPNVSRFQFIAGDRAIAVDSVGITRIVPLDADGPEWALGAGELVRRD